MNVKAQKILRIVLWVFMAWILARGIFSFFNKDTSTAAPIQIPELSIVENDSAKTFAVSFTKEYFTFKANNIDEHTKRLGEFMIKSIDQNAGLEVSNVTQNQEASQAWPWMVKKIDNNHSIITVKTKVLMSGGNESYFYLAVPVASDGEGYQVYELPAVVAPPAIPNLGKLEVVGQKADGPDEKSVIDMLNGFFKAYATGQPAEISYYFMNDKKVVRGLGGLMNYKELQDTNVLKVDKGDIKAETNVVFIDPISQVTYKNHFIISLSKKDNRFYINNIEP